MWSDNEATQDYLNFGVLAETAGEIIRQAKGQPISLGISGSWGVGKSSMIKLIEKSLKASGDNKFIFVDFNAWLYQGYDDARAALMDVIVRELLKQADVNKTNVEKIKELAKRVDWLRFARFAASGVALVHGLPPVGLLGGLGGLVQASVASGEGFKAGVENVANAIGEGSKLIKDKPLPASPPNEIQELRKHFEEVLAEMNKTLVVLVDDLDRCLPATAISTLEAIRLFLFLKNTAFIVAADDKMIRNSVSVHFGNLPEDSELVTNYFDKLIQIPLRVPPLGTQEVRAYMMLLFIENSSLPKPVVDELNAQIAKQLSETWQGKSVDVKFVAALIKDCPKELRSQLDTAEQLSPFMASAKQIAGNPRLIKRFLNTLSIRLSIAHIQGVTVDEAVLTKLLLFERCGGEAAFKHLVTEINNNKDGKPAFLKKYEEQIVDGELLKDIPKEWNSDFASRWLAMPPFLSELDLRPVMHVSRDTLPLIVAVDQLSTEGAELLAGLLKITAKSDLFKENLQKLRQQDIEIIMRKLLEKANQVQKWGKEPALFACLAVTTAIPEQGARLAAFLCRLPVRQLEPAIIPIIGDQPWAIDVFAHWHKSKDLPGPVRKTIESLGKGAK